MNVDVEPFVFVFPESTLFLLLKFSPLLINFSVWLPVAVHFCYAPISTIPVDLPRVTVVASSIHAYKPDVPVELLQVEAIARSIQAYEPDVVLPLSAVFSHPAQLRAAMCSSAAASAYPLGPLHLPGINRQ